MQEREEREKLMVGIPAAISYQTTHTLTPLPFTPPLPCTHTSHKAQEEARFLEETTKLNIFLNGKRDELETWKKSEWEKKQVTPQYTPCISLHPICAHLTYFNRDPWCTVHMHTSLHTTHTQTHTHTPSPSSGSTTCRVTTFQTLPTRRLSAPIYHCMRRTLEIPPLKALSRESNNASL